MELLQCLRQLAYKKNVFLLSRRADLQTERIALDLRQRRMLQELQEILPIAELHNGNYSICEILLPVNLKAHNETQSIALGYVTLLLAQLEEILDLTLRFPVKFQGSKSSIYCTRRCKTFPLYTEADFEEGVALLKLNILQILRSRGIDAEDCNILKSLSKVLNSI